MNITIKTIPSKEQRYRTLGDYWFDEQGNLEVRVTKLNDWRWEFLIALHELVEVALCKDRGITIKEIDEFDKDFEKELPEDNEEEPGEHVHCPYKMEHLFADSIEKQMACQLGLDWYNYHYEGIE